MDGNRFDSLTRAFGSGRSRRGVLKGLGATALGAVGLSKLGAAEAANGGNSDCAHFCTATFPPGAARGQCVSDAAHGTGICYQCGPAAANTGLALCGQTCVNEQADNNNCGACGNVCTSPANGSSTCSAGGCVVTCNSGYQSDGAGGCVARTSCTNTVLAGDATGTQPFYVDDEVTVKFNGATVYADPNTAPAGLRGPISLGATSSGNSLEVTAVNGVDYCGDRSISALYLVCLDDGSSQQLDSGASGSSEGFPPCPPNDVFYDKTFTLSF
jgi:hypothetical protein